MYYKLSFRFRHNSDFEHSRTVKFLFVCKLQQILYIHGYIFMILDLIFLSAA